ncbi:metallophosphoesterase family protein [Oleiharenicola sp. Vm1]|uniref:metallophosphoesterase family protein n=1 Tax=Oleiharenicola sp. Vm1 TaxID=3398393 RepID=UPI0039F61227
MRIAVISDTHDRYPADLPARLAAADEIWHLGDVCEPEVLVEFEMLGKPLHVVLGNNEAHNLWPLELTLERAGWRFFLTHIPPRRAPRARTSSCTATRTCRATRSMPPACAG